MLNKKPSDSLSIQSTLVLPNDTNMLNGLMGGRLLHQMDIVGAIAAQKHSDNSVVTASVDNVSFNQPVSLGSIITIKSWVTRAFRTSMEVKVEVYAENIPEKTPSFKTNEAYFTFVAVDSSMKPIEIPGITPITEDEKVLYDKALERRQFRLVLAGKLSPKDAPELRSLISST